MGAILSNEEKIARARSSRREESLLGVPWDAHGYRYKEDRKRNNRNRRKGRSRRESSEVQGPRARSQSLDAILEELCLSETEGDTGRGTLIPRAKLSANSRGVEGKIQRRSLSQFGADTSSLHAIHLHVERKALLEQSRSNLRSCVSLPFLDQSEWVEDMEADQQSNGPPSYSQDFDACMRQLEAIERNMESQNDLEVTTLPRHGFRDKSPINMDEHPRSLTIPRGRNLKRQMTPTNDSVPLPPDDDIIIHPSECKVEEANCRKIVEKREVKSEPHKKKEGNPIKEEQEQQQQIAEPVDRHTEEEKHKIEIKEEEIEPIYESRSPDKIIIIEPEVKKVIKLSKKDPSHGWYGNLKEQFERLDKELGSRAKKQETTCRITGATLKGSKEANFSDDRAATDRKLYFSKLVRSNKSLIDGELPDPDKVQNIRAMFQENQPRLGGSLQNISTDKQVEVKPERPKSALGSRKEDELRCLTPETAGNARRETASIKTGLDKGSQTDKNRMRARWTDSGSMSSGVSSDLSSCETDQESYCRDQENSVSSEDDLEVVEKHYIENEILERIRSFGTSVTYFGGQMIRCSVGPLVSPTTQAILEEMGQKQPNGSQTTRTFDEFYKKYKETTKKRKVGRTKSFAQEEMYQKTSVFNDTEIEEHKKELETAFGIRRPKGKQTMSKTKLAKSISLDSQIKSFENNIEEKREKNDTKEVKRSQPQPIKVSSTLPSYRTSNEFFDFHRRFSQHKVDMEFEEFEVRDDFSRRDETQANRNEKSNESKSVNDSQSSTPELLQSPRKPVSNERTKEAVTKILKTDSSGSDTIGNDGGTSDEDFQKDNENSVKQKRDSWEEVIQRAQKIRESNSRRGSKESVTFVKASSDTDTKKKSNSTENPEKITVIELSNNICQSETEDAVPKNTTENVPNGVKEVENKKISPLKDAKSEGVSKQTADVQSEKSAAANKRLENCKKYNDGGWKRVETTWESFVQHKRHNSIESFMSLNKTPFDSNSGSRRNSVKKLEDNEMVHRDFCLEKRRNSLEPKQSSQSGRRFSIDSAFLEKNTRFSEKPNGTSFQNIKINSGNTKSKSKPDSEEKRTTDGKFRGIGKEVNDRNHRKRSDSIPIPNSNHSTGHLVEENSDKEQPEYKITIKISQEESEPQKTGNENFEEIIINDQDPLDSLELYYSKGDENGNVEPTSPEKMAPEENTVSEYKRRFDKNKNYKPGHSRWPIETTVVVDMEKKEETLPKLILHSKSNVKTTRRLF